MFTLACEDALPEFVDGGPWSLLSAVSFEERCLAFPRIAKQLLKVSPSTHVMFPIDNGSEWETPCTERQTGNLQRLVAETGWTVVESRFHLAHPNAPSDALQALSALLAGGGPTTLIVDISTMPKACLFPVVREALRAPGVSRLAVAYAEPEKYNDTNLRSDPQTPAGLRFFNHLTPGQRARVAWIPILGFGSFFGGLIYDSIVNSLDLGNRVFPILGFPAFNPGLYDRMLLDNLGSVLTMLQGRTAISSQLLYAPASDPFATKRTILSAISGMDDVHWIGSPLGPKPMALGMLLAAIEAGITVLDCQARSYHPEYSSGCGKAHLYVLK